MKRLSACISSAWVGAVIVVVVVGLAGCGGASTGDDLPTVRLAAAASLGPALEALEPAIESALGIDLQLHLAGSGTLARQVLDGAPTDAVLLAHPDWLAALVDAGRVEPDGRVGLLTNRLIVVGRGGPIGLEALRSQRFTRIAIGDPASVPAGRYAEQALRAAEVWDDVRDRLVTAADVRAALRYAMDGQAEAAIVYASDVGDVGGTADVAVLCEIDPASHEPIVITAGVIDRSAAGRRLVRWLQGDAAARAFADAGFAVTDAP